MPHTGVLIDVAVRSYPKHGLPALAQTSVGSGIPLFLIAYFVLPVNGASNAWAFGLLTFVIGCLVVWCGPINNVVMASVTPPHLRGAIYGIDRMLEGLSAPVGSVLVGVLAEQAYGFKSGGACGGDESSGADAAPLAHALATAMIAPWVICFVCYTALHFFYAEDVKRAASQGASEGGLIELDSAAKRSITDLREASGGSSPSGASPWRSTAALPPACIRAVVEITS